MVGWGGVFDPYVWPLRAVFASHNTYSPLLLHSHSLLTPFLLFSSLYLLSIYHFTPPLILRVTQFTRVTYLCHYLWVYHYLPYSSHLYPSSLPLLALLRGGYTCHYLGYSLNHTFNPIILYYILGLTGFRVCPYLFGNTFLIWACFRRMPILGSRATCQIR